MSTNYEHNGEDETLAARRTAHALGQTAGEDWAAVEAELHAMPQPRQEVEAVAALAVRLKEAARSAPPVEPSAALRAAVEKRLTELESAAAKPSPPAPLPEGEGSRMARPWWRRRLAALALAAACLVAFAVPIARSLKLIEQGKPLEVAKAPTPAERLLNDAAKIVVLGTPTRRKPQGSSKVEQYDISQLDRASVMEMDVDPTLPRPTTPSAHYQNISGASGPSGGKADSQEPAYGGALDFGPRPEMAGALGVGAGQGEGQPGRGGAGTSFGERGNSRGGESTDGNRAGQLVTETLSIHDRIVEGSQGNGQARAPGAKQASEFIEQSTVEEDKPQNQAQEGSKSGERLAHDNNPIAMPSKPGRSSGPGSVNPPKPESIPGIDVLVIRGNPEDAARLEAIKKEVERLQTERQATTDFLMHRSGDEKGENSAREKPSKQVDTYSILSSRESQTSDKSGDQNRGLAASGSGKNNALYLGYRKKPDSSVSSESWKPARVVPNASRLMVGDKEELPLKGMQVDVRVDGFRARVLLDLYYFNDRPQQLEGNFQLRLPDEASPYFFAFGRTVYQAPQVTPTDSMFFKPQQVFLGDTTPDKILALRGNSWEQPEVARMVPKEKAALAYRDTVRRRIDPALVEWSGAGVFQCRVFPLAPQSLHRVTIGYDVDLVRVGDDLELRLDLPEHAPATVVDLNVAAADARQVSLDAPSTQSPDGLRLSYRLVDPKDRPLMVRLRKPGTLMLTGSDEATGDYFATRVTLPLAETVNGGSAANRRADEATLTPSPSPGTVRSMVGRGELDGRSKQAIFLVDTSLSAGPQFSLWTKMLRATLENNRDQIKEFAVLFFNVETFWWQEKYVANTPENVAAVINYADNLALEGATDLGRALQEAAARKWDSKRGKGASGALPPDIFLLSDGAATWGEDRWGLLAAALTRPLSLRERARVREDGNATDKAPALTPGPSPSGRGEKAAVTPGPSPGGRGEPCSALFAYRTGLAGGDSRLLGYLAERTGGAVFSLTSEAEIASASVAHRNRPWKLTGVEMAGSRDLLVVGRPQYVYPGQQLTIVGRLDEHRPDRTDRADHMALVFTLQQGTATQTIKFPMDQVISSELAGRTFGQVATNQLEDVCSVAQAAEPVATAYARHFRITGRTCSLLMLESEQDYARFNIRPEEDSFVVKERPADAIVGKAIAEAVAAMSDPKASFLAWYNRLGAPGTSEVRFDLPAALKVFIDGLPDETFAPQAPPLACKLRQRQDLPENLRQPWHTGMADYETLDAEARRRLAACGPDDALRCLSSLVEEQPGDAALLRDLAFTAIDWQRPGEAYHLLRRASHARTFEPITFHALAHCLEQMGRADLAIIYYELACGGQWDQRFGDMHNIALLDYARFLRRVVEGRLKSAMPGYAQSRLDTLTAMNLRDTADVAALIFWNTDGTDVDLHVVEPSGEECFYQHTQTASGGHISRDVTTGYGPELYLLPKAPPGKYEISAHYFASDANRATTRTKVMAFIYENWGAKDERVATKSLALTGQSEKHALATVKR